LITLAHHILEEQAVYHLSGVCEFITHTVSVRVSKVCVIMNQGLITLVVVYKGAVDKFGVSLDEELRRLVVHGFLHLLGYDHGKSGEEKKMLALQEKILGV